ncbi:hypothetical protein ACFOD4_10525 [Pseudoroseomonas globiformis]|uniref:Uncharacterized protein n=1 Tax=Teichococcus globiformis TaxID=2307229 RepID=A0ABV7G3A6_9PROT
MIAQLKSQNFGSVVVQFGQPRHRRALGSIALPSILSQKVALAALAKV